MTTKHTEHESYPIQPVLGNTMVISSPFLIPLYMTDSSHCILMDTGTDTMREQLERTLDEAGLTPIGILCTHTHFDHYGNAGYFSERYDCPIALPLGEAEVCRTLDSIKSYMFCFSAGQVAADPNMAALPCIVDHVIRPEETDTMFRGVRFGVIHTPGHSIDHVSYVTPDRVCYAGDALMSGHSLHASKLPYAFHMDVNLASMEKLRDLSCPKMILAHRGVADPPYDGLVDENIENIRHEVEKISALIDRQMTVEEVYRTVQEALEIRVSSPVKALNMERFLRPYLEYLIDRGSHRQSVRDGLLCYEPV
mgnify:CR=1 FL=1